MKQGLIRCVNLDEDGIAIVTPKTKGVFRLLPTEEAKIEINQGQSKIVSINNPSTIRVPSLCPYFDQCGGCVFHHMNYNSQLDYKFRTVSNYFNFTKTRIEKVLGDTDPYHYRTKNQMVAFKNNKKQITLGMYQYNSHYPTNVSDCIIQDKLANRIFNSIQLLLREFKIEPYNEDRAEGLLRHVLVKVGYKTNQVMVVFVISEPDFMGRKILFKKIVDKHPEIKTIITDHNTRRSSAILSNKQRIHIGQGYIEDECLGFRFMISASSFFQINPRQTEVLYQKALQLANILPHEKVLDAYSGTGTIGILASQYAKEVICVESNAQAVADAKNNVKNNKVSNVKVVCADATQYVMDCVAHHVMFDCILLDPPRSGLTPTFVDALLRLAPKRIVYVSCEPKTQAQDIKLLHHQYTIETIQPVDMFPFTRHCESIVLLTRK